MVREAEFTWPRQRSAANQRNIRARVMWGTERSTRDEARSLRKDSSNGMNGRYSQRLFKAQGSDVGRNGRSGRLVLGHSMPLNNCPAFDERGALPNDSL